MAFRNAVLWMLVVLMGLQIGAGLYETLVLVPLWSSAPPQSIVTYQTEPLAPDAHLFWSFMTPLVGVLSLINVIVAWREAGPHRRWWLAGAGVSLAMVIVTFSYFVPLFIKVFPRAAQLPAAEVQARVRWWVRLNWLRAVVLIAAWLALLNAFTLSRWKRKTQVDTADPIA
jgi:hypothetical protein